MAIFECTEEGYALNLNPYQIFVFINEKTKPYWNCSRNCRKDTNPMRLSYFLLILQKRKSLWMSPTIHNYTNL